MENIFLKKYNLWIKENVYPFAEKINFQRTHSLKELCALDKKKFLKIQEVIICGKIKFQRPHKNSVFITLQEELSYFQIYFKRDNFLDKWEQILRFDLGDCLIIKGKTFLTKVKEKTIKVKSWQLVSKTFVAFSDKTSKERKKETKYLNRVFDFILNKEKREVFYTRGKIISLLRNYFDKKGFLEVETPILQPIFGGAFAMPFKTKYNSLRKKDFFLRVAPELYLKRLITSGFDKVYEIGKAFRNEGIDHKHNPEFTILEAYIAYRDYDYWVNFIEECIKKIVIEIKGKLIIDYQGKEINFQSKWRYISVTDLLFEEIGIDFRKIQNFSEAKKIAKKFNLQLKDYFFDVGHIINLFFEEKIEKTLIQPTIVHGFPTIISPLAKVDHYDKRYAKRFELFVNGEEYGNCFFELNDPFEQKKRFEEQQKEKKLGNFEISEIDEDYIKVLKHGMPATTGIGIGIDRLIMLLTNKKNIKDVIFFPMMRSIV